eukprot:m.671354 g.671354  ORF g.671354 m.671354 type:complete len:70 (+) comp22771_c0_seq2:267-476(+)
MLYLIVAPIDIITADLFQKVKIVVHAALYPSVLAHMSSSTHVIFNGYFLMNQNTISTGFATRHEWHRFL